ncbi:endonuclease III-like protein 1 [Eupeodes corollae]|uniref:endonuclease III-like protein 1 n=1 Tax=Eupeodes corollae TaxID=290404 RepID=UPI002491B4F1|nr:endonuclease III-like protein 1 [Eupeodes corollae]
MNLFKRIGNIIWKMAPRRKPIDLPEKLIQQEKTKVAPIRDIEDLTKSETTKSPYFSPIKTRNQRDVITKAAVTESATSKLEPTASLASQVPPISTAVPPPVQVKDVAEEKLPKKEKQTAKESKRTKEIKEIFEGLKNLPENDGPIEILKPSDAVPLVQPKIVAKSKKIPKIKRVPKEKVSPKVFKSKSLPEEENAQTSSSQEALKKEEPLPSPVKVTKRKSKDTPKSPEIKQDKWEPNNWTQILENIRHMRANVPAPVDTMGCDRYSDENADEKTKRFHVLLALMLSSQTKDEVTHEAMRRLRTESNCTPRVIADMETQKLEQLLYPVSFYKNKAKYLKNTSQILIDQYDSDIPNDIKGLIKLPGVGPKMAHICMNAAWDIVTGIGVDVHVHRISNRLGWVRQETKQPEQTRKELESWLPSEHWKEVNHLLVGFGQTICTPTKPKCGECLNKAICPAAFAVKPKKVKAEKVVL